MLLHLFVVVVVAVAVCDGRATSLSKSPDTAKQSPPGESQTLPSPAGQVAAPNGRMTAEPRRKITFDPCQGRPCMVYEDKTHIYWEYFRRSIREARWLKGKKKPFDTSLDDSVHFKDLDDYIKKNDSMFWALPAVLMFEAPVHEFSRIKTVLNDHRDIMRVAQHKLNGSNFDPYSAAFKELLRLESIGAELILEAAKNYSKIVSVTITNYLNENYQKNLSNPTAPLNDPPAPVKPNFTIMTQPEMEVFIKVFQGTVQGCFTALFELSLFINRNNASAFYCANYPNRIHEAWLPVNPLDNFFV